MSVKTRLRLIEKSRYRPQPWLVLEFLEPTHEQLHLIEQAQSTGQFCVVFNPVDASAWILGGGVAPWWLEVEQNVGIH
ncbi:MAG: hypothetical protein Q7T96_01605 [Methylobacter sp.]|nr:hypothetical protein [Methylobacter sp.]